MSRQSCMERPCTLHISGLPSVWSSVLLKVVRLVVVGETQLGKANANSRVALCTLRLPDSEKTRVHAKLTTVPSTCRLQSHPNQILEERL